jgi:outer membrane lipoprotein carrier protein
MPARTFVSTLAFTAALAVPFVATGGFAQSAPATPPLAPAAVAATPSASPADRAKVDDLVAKVQAFYDKTASFQSEFSQEFLVKAYNTKKVSTGSVTFQKPGKMDWVYADPKDNRVVSDGTTLRVYEAANKQMFEQPVNNSQYPAALSFLTGQGKLADAFKFELHDGARYGFTGGSVLVGEPKVATPAYRTVLFYVDTNTSQIRRVMIIDGQGNRNRFDFVKPRVNVAVDANQFKFTPPAGTSIVRP